MRTLSFHWRGRKTAQTFGGLGIVRWRTINVIAFSCFPTKQDYLHHPIKHGSLLTFQSLWKTINWEKREGTKTITKLSISSPCRCHHLIDWLPRVLDTPQAPGIPLAKILHQECLGKRQVFRVLRRLGLFLLLLLSLLLLQWLFLLLLL